MVSKELEKCVDALGAVVRSVVVAMAAVVAVSWVAMAVVAVWQEGQAVIGGL